MRRSNIPTKAKRVKRMGRVYVGFMNVEKAYDRVKRESLWQVLRMSDAVGKLMNEIKSMYANSLSCVRVKGRDSECFRIEKGIRL